VHSTFSSVICWQITLLYTCSMFHCCCYISLLLYLNLYFTVMDILLQIRMLIPLEIFHTSGKRICMLRYVTSVEALTCYMVA